MQELLTKYKNLKKQLACDPGSEASSDEVMWNDQIQGEIEDLLKDTNSDVAKQIRLGHI